MGNIILPPGYNEPDRKRNEVTGAYDEISENNLSKDMKIFKLQKRQSELDDFLNEFGNAKDDPTGKAADDIRAAIIEEIQMIKVDLERLRK